MRPSERTPDELCGCRTAGQEPDRRSLREIHIRTRPEGLAGIAHLFHGRAGVRPPGRIEGVDGIVERARGALEPLDASQHLLGNTVVDVDGDDATSICYFQAQHVRAGTPGGDTYFIAGSYADRLVRTPQGWRIAERVQAYLWRDGNRAVVAR
jgi:hypothetical protein